MIREATKDDLPSATSLFKDLGYNVSQSLLEERFDTFFSNPAHSLMVDDQDGALNGIIGAQVITPFHSKSKIGRITTLVFDESYRGNQSGKQLLQAVEVFLKDQGCGSVEVSSGLVRTKVLPVIKQQGYQGGENYCAKKL